MTTRFRLGVLVATAASPSRPVRAAARRPHPRPTHHIAPAALGARRGIGARRVAPAPPPAARVGSGTRRPR